jgi:phosphorylase superfamily protein
VRWAAVQEDPKNSLSLEMAFALAAPSSGDDAQITVGPIGILGIPEETSQLVASLKDPEERISGGRDTFVSDASKVQELRSKFNADGVEMEGAAVAQICSQYEIPLLVIRSITDRADGSSYTDYHNFVRIAAQNSSAFVIAILKQLQSQESGKNPKEVNHWLLAFELAFSEGSPYALEVGDLHTLSYEVPEIALTTETCYNWT